ncbi:MAG: hypothetical protein JW731_07460 [Bacteroidales bacterium]|nr:hypothetical protein [Bacteroidales bacterium]
MHRKQKNIISLFLLIVLLLPTVLNISHHHHGEGDYLLKSQWKIDVKCEIRDYQGLFFSIIGPVLPDQNIEFIATIHEIATFPFLSNYLAQSVLLRAPPAGQII